MSEINTLYFVYGMSIMFYGMMTWLFSRLPHTRLKNMISVLMLVIALQYVKDLFFIDAAAPDMGISNDVAASLDFVTVPFYGLIVFELCRPGWLSLRAMAGLLSPFVVFTLLYIVTRSQFIFSSVVVASSLFGLFCLIWALRELPVYHRRLKEEYSYDEDINLYWLRGVMLLFVTILTMWVMSCFYTIPLTEVFYMLSSLVGWAVVCYFIHRQQSVLNGLREKSAVTIETPDEQPMPEDDITDELGRKLHVLFDEEHIYLDSKLRLSALALRIGTNRTYLSQYFNQHCSQSFYEYVNNYRLAHSESLLRDTDYTLDTLAAMSGFNSLSTFRRAFTASHGCSPQEYRAEKSLPNSPRRGGSN